MQLTSTLPGPLLITLEVGASDARDARFCVQLADQSLDLSAQVCDLAVLGLVLGAAPGTGVLSESGIHGELDDAAATQGVWSLAGVSAATVLTEDGVTVVSADQLGAWAALGVLRAVSDAPAAR